MGQANLIALCGVPWTSSKKLPPAPYIYEESDIEAAPVTFKTVDSVILMRSSPPPLASSSSGTSSSSSPSPRKSISLNKFVAQSAGAVERDRAQHVDGSELEYESFFDGGNHATPLQLLFSGGRLQDSEARTLSPSLASDGSPTPRSSEVRLLPFPIHCFEIITLTTTQNRPASRAVAPREPWKTFWPPARCLCAARTRASKAWTRGSARASCPLLPLM